MKYTQLKTDGNPAKALSVFLGKLLSESLADAVLAASPTPHSPLPMPMLFADPEKIQFADPLAPVSPFNTARQAAMILRQETDKKIALVLRPCEIRALIELVKLNQCNLQNTLLIGIECLGRMENGMYLEKVSENENFTAEFYHRPDLQEPICSSCRICTKFIPANADLTVCVIGFSVSESIGVSAQSQHGADILEKIGMPAELEWAEREQLIKNIHNQRLGEKNHIFTQTTEKTDSIEKFQRYFAACLNCYNCRVACPVCYCRECVFLTDVFAHDPQVLLRRAEKRGMIKLPADTTMFHMTRMAHMAHACVACGHCTSVCPSNIPVADVFIKVGAEVQALYSYEPGRDVSEPMPMLVFDAAGEKNGKNKE